jgi:hypothetical protein
MAEPAKENPAAATAEDESIEIVDVRHEQVAPLAL